MDVPIPDLDPKSQQLVRVFQIPYANRVWGYARDMGHRVVSELSKDIGSVLISVHGVGTDSVLEAHIAESLAANCGLKAYMSFESRTSRWRGFSRLQPFHDSPLGLHSAYAAYEASLLLMSTVEVCSRTAAAPVLVAHSRGALILAKASMLWQGLTAATYLQDQYSRDEVWARIPGFMDSWRRLDTSTQHLLLADAEAISNTRIIAVTACPAVSSDDPGWASLQSWSEGRLWNLYTKRDWFLFFVGNRERGYIPSLGERNIRFHLRHGNFSGNPLVQKVVANLLRHGDLTRETVDRLIQHYFTEQKLAPAVDPVPRSPFLRLRR
jgi:hypothetical protein